MIYRTLISVLLLAVLTACTPKFDWREISVGDGKVQAILPGKPQTYTRVLEFQGYELEFTLTGASVDGTVFAVGYAPLPPELQQKPQLATEMAQTVVRSFYQKVGVEPPEQLPDWGTTFEVQGGPPGNEAKVRARAWLRSDALVEAIVTGPAASFPTREADEFLVTVRAGAR